MNNSQNKSPLESKKWVMSLIGLGFVMIVYGLTSILVIQNSSVATHLVNLATLVITFLGSLVGVYLTGQSFVEWKSHSVMQSEVENKITHEELSENKTINIVHNIEVDKTIIGNQKDDDYVVDILAVNSDNI